MIVLERLRTVNSAFPYYASHTEPQEVTMFLMKVRQPTMSRNVAEVQVGERVIRIQGCFIFL